MALGLYPIVDPLAPLLWLAWAVPEARVRPHVPPPLVLDTRPGMAGQPRAYLALAVVRNRRAHLAGLPGLHATWVQANFRTYVRHPAAPDVPAVYFFGSYVSSRVLTGLAGLLAPHVWYAPTRLGGRVPAGPADAAWSLHLAMRGPLGLVRVDAVGLCVRPPAVPGWTGPTAAQHFLTQRPYGYMRARGGGLINQPVAHAEPAPWTGAASHVVASPWTHWGLLSAAEIAEPLAVWAAPHTAFRAALPRPAAWG